MAEAGEVRELRIERDVRPDVEAARHVVHRDRRHARYEQAGDRRLRAGRRGLEAGEEVLEETVAVAEFIVRSLASSSPCRVL